MKNLFSKKLTVISNIKSSTLTKEYKKLREEIWEKKLEIMSQQNKPFWNGVLYYLDSFDENDLELKLAISTCEYKDLVVKEDKIGKMYIDNVLFNKSYMNVQCLIIDKAENFIFGVGEDKSLIPVGGTLRNDNFEITSYLDVEKYVLNEIEVETNLEIINKNLKFLGVVDNEGIFTFLFAYHLDFIFSKDREYLKRGEFKTEIILNKNAILNNNKVFTNRFESIQPYLKKYL